MRLLTHNVLKNHSADAKGNGYPLKLINVTNVRIDTIDDSNNDNNDYQVEFVKSILPTLHWGALVQASKAVGITTVPEQLLDDMIQDISFIKAIYHILLHVHIVDAVLVCPVTQKQFSIQNEIPNMMIEESECERVRY